MKSLHKILIYLLSFIVITPISSQTYQPIPTDSVWWVEYETGLYIDNFYCNYETYRYIYPSGVVNIMGTDYFQFKQNSETTYSFAIMPPPNVTCPSKSISTGKHYAFIRNDSINKKVFLYDTVVNHVELLLYDFDVQVGDSLFMQSGHPIRPYHCPWEDSAAVVSIDSVDLGGEYRRSILIYPLNNGYNTFIEGIGSISGFAMNVYCDNFADQYHTELICYHYKNLSYGNTSSSYCTSTLSLNDELLLATNIIKPLGGNTYHIQNDDAAEIDLYIFDMLGKQVYSAHWINSGYFTLSGLPSGMYTMKLWYNYHPVQPYKFMVQH